MSEQIFEVLLNDYVWAVSSATHFEFLSFMILVRRSGLLFCLDFSREGVVGAEIVVSAVKSELSAFESKKIALNSLKLSFPSPTASWQRKIYCVCFTVSSRPFYLKASRILSGVIYSELSVSKCLNKA